LSTYIHTTAFGLLVRLNYQFIDRINNTTGKVIHLVVAFLH
jgi:hypothetical protein